jgi:two-component system CheB/CheR fusion protein
LPYRDIEDRIAGVVVTFVDITDHKGLETALRRAMAYSEQIIETLPEPILVLTPELTVETANAAFYEHFTVRPEDTKGRKVYDLGNGQWDIPSLRDLLEKILPNREVFNGYEVDHVFQGLGRRIMVVNGRQIKHLNLILLGISDITSQREAEKELAELNRRLLEAERTKSASR